MRSIARYLLAWIMGALLLGGLMVVLVVYVVTLEEMHEGFDANLQSIAEAVANTRQAASVASSAGSPLPAAPAAPNASASAADNDEEGVVLHAWDQSGRRAFVSDPRVSLPYARSTGWSTHRIEGQDWTVYSIRREWGVAQAAQRVAARRQMAAESAAKVTLPLVGMAVVVGGLLLYGLRRGLQPLELTAREIARRSDGSLDPIELQGVPREFHSIVDSTNGLMHRLGAALGGQRRFIADAAHELRTPVTALRLQLELLRKSDEMGRQQAIEELAAGIARAERLTQQLLAIARVEPDGAELRIAPVSLGDLVRNTVTAFSMRAERQGIDLGADVPEDVSVLGDLEQLSVLLSNLVENAIRYTPEGGVVDVIARKVGSGALLVVRDDGPGIPENERERVFERFYRCVDAPAAARDPGGSGLGLAIVKRIAQRHGAKVELSAGPKGLGLQVRVVFGSLPTRSPDC
jgi:two-component system OmpR family sensor kinase